MSTFISPNGNREVWDEKPADYFTPDEWVALHPPPEPEPTPDARTPAEKRQDAYIYEVDGLRDRALSYLIERDSWLEVGNDEAAAASGAKAKQAMADYLAVKQEIRERYPDDAGEVA